MDRGHVLVMSMWDDHDANMLWLDSDYPLDKDPWAPPMTLEQLPPPLPALLSLLSLPSLPSLLTSLLQPREEDLGAAWGENWARVSHKLPGTPVLSSSTLWRTTSLTVL